MRSVLDEPRIGLTMVHKTPGAPELKGSRRAGFKFSDLPVALGDLGLW